MLNHRALPITELEQSRRAKWVEERENGSWSIDDDDDDDDVHCGDASALSETSHP